MVPACRSASRSQVRQAVEVQVTVLVPVGEALVRVRRYSLVDTPLISTVRVPFGKQKPSANSQSAPLAGLLVGQATGPLGPWVVAFWQTGRGLHGPSPVAVRPSDPPTQVSKVFGSL